MIKDMYKDRLVNGIQVTFSGLDEKDLHALKMLDSHIYMLQNYGSAEGQTGTKIYDTEVFELHTMWCSFLIKSPIGKEVAHIVKPILEKLYDVVIENQELCRMQNVKKIPRRLRLDYLPKQPLRIQSYSFDQLAPEVQKTIATVECKERELAEEGPRKVVEKYLRENPNGTDYPILDPNLWPIFKLAGLCHAKYNNLDLFSVMSSIGQKITNVAKKNTGLKIKMENR